MRRVPIGDEPVGAHRPETVAGRLASEIVDNLEVLHHLENRMAPSRDELLARLDAVVATAAAKAGGEDEVLAAVDERVTALETAFGLAAPAADPNQPV